MPSDFFFDPPSLDIQMLRPVAIFKWQHLRNSAVQYAIAAEEQYLQFHLFMLRNLRHTRHGRLGDPPYRYELAFSVRAGAVKAAVLIATSIIEAALRSIAETRGYALSADPRRRTFGNVIRAWEVNGLPRPDVAEIWARVRALHAVRNFVHLHQAANTVDAAWENVLTSEQVLLDDALVSIEHVAALVA